METWPKVEGDKGRAAISPPTGVVICSTMFSIAQQGLELITHGNMTACQGSRRAEHFFRPRLRNARQGSKGTALTIRGPPSAPCDVELEPGGQESKAEVRADNGRLVQDSDRATPRLALLSSIWWSLLGTLHFRVQHSKRRFLIADVASQSVHARHARAVSLLGASLGLGCLSGRICDCSPDHGLRACDNRWSGR